MLISIFDFFKKLEYIFESIKQQIKLVNINFIGINNTFCDAAESWQFGLQDPATPVFEGMIFFHNYLFFFFIGNWIYSILVTLCNYFIF